MGRLNLPMTPTRSASSAGWSSGVDVYPGAGHRSGSGCSDGADGVNRLLLAAGLCPRPAERPAMAFTRAHLVLGTRIVGPDEHLPDAPEISTVPLRENLPVSQEIG
ncbi:hypothetical protein GCM10022215_19250 [Nocardioides fonticola]|uniref:Uncharacterized protein n=1 Tax=Nocardioides fonticola TaxID=450363 RepID=A0ABP7XI80_9ACTN